MLSCALRRPVGSGGDICGFLRFVVDQPAEKTRFISSLKSLKRLKLLNCAATSKRRISYEISTSDVLISDFVFQPLKGCRRKNKTMFMQRTETELLESVTGMTVDMWTFIKVTFHKSNNELTKDRPVLDKEHTARSEASIASGRVG